MRAASPIGAGSTLGAASFRQGAGGVLRPAVASAASAGRVAVTGAAVLGGRLDAPAAAVAGDIPLLTASAVAGTFGAVTGGYDPIYGPTDVKLRRHGGEAPALQATAPDSADTVDTAPQRHDHWRRRPDRRWPPRFRPLGGRGARRDRPRPLAGRRDLLELRLGAGLMGRDGAHGVAAVAQAGAAHDRAGPHRT